jgi:hypothetical protein
VRLVNVFELLGLKNSSNIKRIHENILVIQKQNFNGLSRVERMGAWRDGRLTI